MTQPNMTDAETAAHIRQWLDTPQSIWSWPADACGYDQQVKFIEYRWSRYKEIQAKTLTFRQLVLEYAEKLEGKP